MKATVWVEILPDRWQSWNDLPYGMKVGRIRKRPPKGELRRDFVPVEIEVDARERWGETRGVL